MPYPIIDAHQHFWKFDLQRDSWITEEMKILRKDYLPPDVEIVFKQNHVSGSVAIQADSSENENQFLLELANHYPYIKGVVGWIDLQSEGLEERLNYYQKFPLLKGFRHLLQGEKQRDIMLSPVFQKGVGLLNKYGFSFDLLILQDQLGFAEKLAGAFPDQHFVINHLAKPSIKKGMIAEWRVAMKKFAPLQNVYCKISGMVTEADFEFWENDDFLPYISTVLETFGTKRIMFGSDWPVCLQAGSYDQVKQITEDYFKSFSNSEQSDFFGGNAITFYKLN
ncbi:MAG TPA: amidohydrolase family protein [Puia sp.]|jgi:L-fuconolactonase|nr:amidohydrolase family protein [Puia sp.]